MFSLHKFSLKKLHYFNGIFCQSILPRDSFSPESGGRVKPSTAIEASTNTKVRHKKYRIPTYQDTGDDQVTEVVESPPPDLDCEGDVQVGSRTALIENFIPFGRNSWDRNCHQKYSNARQDICMQLWVDLMNSSKSKIMSTRWVLDTICWSYSSQCLVSIHY